MSENTVPFRYTLRPIPSATGYVPVVGEPYNPPAQQFSLHLQVQLPQADPPLGNRDYGLAVDWKDSAGMRSSADKVQSLASDKPYSTGTLELTEDGKLLAHYLPENLETTYTVELTGEPAEYVKSALVKLFAHDYVAETMQLEDEDEEPDDDDNETQAPNIVAAYWDSNPDDEGDDEDEYED